MVGLRQTRGWCYAERPIRAMVYLHTSSGAGGPQVPADGEVGASMSFVPFRQIIREAYTMSRVTHGGRRAVPRPMLATGITSQML